jgi:hypothetical protein
MGLRVGRIPGFQVSAHFGHPQKRPPDVPGWGMAGWVLEATAERQVPGKADLQCPIFDGGRVLELRCSLLPAGLAGNRGKLDADVTTTG